MALRMVAVVVYPKSNTVVYCGHAGHRAHALLAACHRRMARFAAKSDDPRAFATVAGPPVSGSTAR